MKTFYYLLFLSYCTATAHWQSLYTPARSAYTKETWHTEKTSNPNKSVCVFCTELALQQDEKTFIIKRFEHTYVCLNPFPYQHGHLLILPNRHIANLGDLLPEERAELMEVITFSVHALKEAFKIDGANIGINIGSAAGASKPDHLHVQVVPRWHNDTSWIHTIGQTAVIAVDMHEVYQTLKKIFSTIPN